MKKFYSALAFLAIGATAMAAPVAQSVKVTEADMAYMNASLIECQALVADGELAPIDTRSYTDNNGDIWCIKMYRTGTLGEAWGSNGQPIEKWPFYAVECSVAKQNGKTGAVVNQCYARLFWPSKFAYEHILDKNFQGTPDYSMLDADTFFKNAMTGKGSKGFKSRTDGTSIYFYTPNASEDAVEYWGMMRLTPVTINGTQYTDANAINFTNDASLTFTSYDNEDEDGTQYGMNVNFTYTAGGNVTCNYQGAAALFIPGSVSRINLDKMYLWNAGVLDGDSDDNALFAPYYEWGPFQQFYFAANGEDLETGIKNGTTDFNFAINKVTLNFRKSGLDFVRRNTFNILGGMLMAPTTIDMDKPYGTWTMGEVKMVNSLPELEPKAWMMFPWNVDKTAWSGNSTTQSYGMECVLEQTYETFIPKTQMAIGTKNGFEIYGENKWGGKLMGTCNAQIKYFKDSKDMKSYTPLASTGTIPSIIPDDQGGVETISGDAETAKVTVANGKIMINAENDANVYVYALNGAMINAANVKAGEVKAIAVEKGAYVVKVGKKATKVVL